MWILKIILSVYITVIWIIVGILLFPILILTLDGGTFLSVVENFYMSLMDSIWTKNH